MSATYVYAIIPTTESLIFDAAGMDDDTVYALPQQGLAAVVSASPALDYRKLDRPEAARYLMVHQRVVERVMEEFPVLPVKFGTTLPDGTWVRRLLTQGASLFDAALRQLGNQVQTEIVVLWPLREIISQIAREPAIAQLRSELAAHPEAATVAGRMALGKKVQRSLVQRRAELQERLLPPLTQDALDVISNPLMDDGMVINIGLLLDEKGRDSLDERMERLDAEFDGQLTFRCIGPLPPYSFATIELEIPSFEAIDAARRRLGLGERVALTEIRRAYHQLAGQTHPDHNAASPDAVAAMALLTEAHELLSAYGSSRAQQANQSPTAPCCFDRQTVEQALLIQIGRQEISA